MPRRTPYEVLGISNHATADEINHAYRARILQWHSDRHEHDRRAASMRFSEINRAYKELTRTVYLDSDFEEPFVMTTNKHVQSTPLHRRSSDSSGSSSSLSSGSRNDSLDSKGSISPTTPSSSFKESPAMAAWPPTPLASSPYRPEVKPTLTYENWRAGSDLPETFKNKPYTPSHLSHTKHRTPDIPRQPRRPPTPAHPPLAHPGNAGSSASPIRRPAISVVVPQSIPNARHPASGKQYVNVFGQVTTQPTHSSPYNLPLISIGLGPTGEWTYSLPLSLEELFSGIKIKFPIVRRLLSGRSRTVTLDLDIPPGCRPSSHLFCRRVGHEIKAGLLQDIAFIIEDKVHARFKRLESRDDLVLDIRVPWADSMRQCGAEASFPGIDGQPLSIFIDYPRSKASEGRNVLKGAGMPVRHGGKVVGRGDLIVQWEITMPTEEQAKLKDFVKRFWKK